MTDTLDAIRARDAEDIKITLDSTGADWRRALWQVAADRRTLLAEVDRLTVEPARRITLVNMTLEAERARIAEGVRGLDAPVITPPTSPAVQRWYSEGFERAIRDVLALLEGDR